MGFVQNNKKIYFQLKKGFSKDFFLVQYGEIDNPELSEYFNHALPYPFFRLKKLMLSKFKLAELDSNIFNDFCQEIISFDNDNNIDEVKIDEFFNYFEYLPLKLKENLEHEIQNYNIFNKKLLDEKLKEIFKYFLTFNPPPTNLSELQTYIGIDINKLENYDEPNNLLAISYDENFALPKYLFYSLLVKEKSKNIDLEILKENLMYVKVYNNYELESNPDAHIEDFYKIPEDSSFLHFFSHFIKSEIEICKNNFKDELFNIEDEFIYFDKIIEKALQDYLDLNKLLYEDKSFFSPLIKEFRLQYSNLLNWILSEFKLYLTIELTTKIEKAISPRTNIRTFSTPNRYSLDINKSKKIVQELQFNGYLDYRTTPELFQSLFNHKQSLEGVIYWKKGIGTLYTFIELLKEKGIINNTNIWEISSRYFYIKDTPISTQKLRDAKTSTHTQTINNLNEIISLF